MSIARFLRTVRYLKPIQIVGRLYLFLPSRKPAPAPAPAKRSRLAAGWVAPPPSEQSFFPPDRFEFLGEDHRLEAIGWDDPEIAKLWRYNLHYFDDLIGEDAQDRAASQCELIGRWIRENPPFAGTGWEPYPISRRAVNWIKWDLAGHGLADDQRASLAHQMRWLARRLEVHLLGNHLLANAKTLLFAGLYFEGAEATRWADTGARILCEQLSEQVLEDGSHFELSTMYHALILEDVLDIGNILSAACVSSSGEGAQAELVRRWRGIAQRMRVWLASMSHPDGEISLFNDAAFGIAPPPAALDAYADRLGLDPVAAPEACEWLSASGYARAELGEAVLLADIAQVGPDYLPGHAHADTLSFELSLYSRRVLVNGGTSLYGNSPERLRQRSTAAHNTVELAGQNSSEIWSSFRVGRRARPILAALSRREGMVELRGAHDGYAHLPGRPIHQRTWRLSEDELIVEDAVSSSTPGSAHFLFHPDLQVELDEAGQRGHIRHPDGMRARFDVLAGRGALHLASYHPRFGEAARAVKLVVALDEGRSKVRLAWEGA